MYMYPRYHDIAAAVVDGGRLCGRCSGSSIARRRGLVSAFLRCLIYRLHNPGQSSLPIALGTLLLVLLLAHTILLRADFYGTSMIVASTAGRGRLLHPEGHFEALAELELGHDGCE